MGITTSKVPAHRKAVKAPQVTAADRAVLALKSHRQRLGGEQKRIEGEIEKTRAAAKEQLTKGNRDRAALLLAIGKRQKEALLQVEQSKLKVEEQLLDIEAARRTRDSAVLAEEVNGVLKELLATVTAERVMRIQEEGDDIRAQMAEVTELLGYGAGQTVESDAEVARELEALQQQVARERVEREGLPAQPVTDQLPAVAVAEPQADSANAAETPAAPAAKTDALVPA